VQIPGRLSDTTLGDVLGALARAQVTGLVRLREPMGHGVDREHRIFLARGEVVAVETDARVPVLGEILMQHGLLDAAAQRRLRQRLTGGARQRVGELLVQEGYVSSDVVGAALRKQLRSKLDALFLVREATLSFHVACVVPPCTVAPLGPREFLRGRPRARDRQASSLRGAPWRARTNAHARASEGQGSARGVHGAADVPRGAPDVRSASSARGAGGSGAASGPARSAHARANGAPSSDAHAPPRHPHSGPAARKRSEALALLGLPESATSAEVTRAFRQWATRLHPDRHVHASEAERSAMAQRFAAMSAAYHTVLG
jgi:hypothetical protein